MLAEHSMDGQLNQNPEHSMDGQLNQNLPNQFVSEIKYFII